MPDTVFALNVTDLRCSTTVADACSWLATCEARTGRLSEAEAHHKGAARAVEECGLVEAVNRGVHAQQHVRAFSKDFAKVKALVKAVYALLLPAATASMSALRAFERPRSGHTEGDGDAELVDNGLTTAATPPPASLECPQDVLTCACALLHERMQLYGARGKHGKAAAIACGPLLSCSAALEACFPLRGRPGQAGIPLPPIPAAQVLDAAAVMLASAASSGISSSCASASAAALLRLRVGFIALATGFADTRSRGGGAAQRRGAAAGGEGDGDGGNVYGVALFTDVVTLDARCLGSTDAWKTLLTAPNAVTSTATSGAAAKLTWLPQKLLAAVEDAAEQVLAHGDSWDVCFDAKPGPTSSGQRGGDADGEEATDIAQALSMALLPYANVLMGGTIGPQQAPPPPPSPAERSVRAPLAARVARAAASLCGQAKHAGNQGEALHMLGAALFYTADSASADSSSSKKTQLLEEAGVAFSASADAKTFCGAESAEPATNQGEATAAAGLCESLLFLAKIHWDLERYTACEECQSRAMAAGRARLGDGHPVTRKALSAMMDTRTKRKALAAAIKSTATEATPAAAKPTVANAAEAKPVAAEAIAAEPAAVEASAAKPADAEPNAVEPSAATEPIAAESTTARPAPE